MANLKEQEKWEAGIYQIEESDPVHGGEEGITNKPLKQLANRTMWLKKQAESLRKKVTPKSLTAETTNEETDDGHSHELPQGSTTEKGLIQLTNELNSDSENLGLTAKAGKTLKAFIDAILRNLNNYIPNSKKSDAVDSSSSDTVATSFAAKKAYDKAVEAEKKALPVGSIVSFPKAITNPEGFLRCDGTTFSQSLYPDLFRALNDSNQLPNLHRSDIGMTAYFATDNIPDGWLAFDDIASRVNERDYPELYQYLVDKYGSIANVPKAEDRFIRNVNEGLSVGQKQNATAGAVDTYGGTTLAGLFVTEDSNPDGRHIQKTRDTIGGDNFHTDEYILHKGGSSRGGLYALWSSPSGGIINPDGTSDGASKDIVLYGMRPRSIVLKLCIKARSTFDDVQFWIKAFGSVSNVGELDASQLAYNLHTHTHTSDQISDFDTSVDKRIEQLFTYRKIGDFEIRKYPDGTMVQLYEITGNASMSWGGVNTFTWAEAFTDTPVVFGQNKGNNTKASMICQLAILNTSTKSTCDWTAYDNDYSISDMSFHFLAIGRWI